MMNSENLFKVNMVASNMENEANILAGKMSEIQKMGENDGKSIEDMLSSAEAELKIMLANIERMRKFMKESA